MNDIESALREELHADHYHLVPSTPLAGPIQRRVRRRRRLRYGAAVGATVLLVGGSLTLLPVLLSSGTEHPASPPAATLASGDPAASGSGDPAASGSGDPTGSGSAAPSTSVADVGGLPVKGLPEYLVAAADPKAAMRADPALAVQPTGGQQRAFTRSGKPGPVDRVVVIVDFNEPLGLVGTTVTPEWILAGPLGGLQTLVTDDPRSSTSYLTAWSPTGRRWFIAVTATDAATRLAVLKNIATQTLPGT